MNGNFIGVNISQAQHDVNSFLETINSIVNYFNNSSIDFFSSLNKA